MSDQIQETEASAAEGAMDSSDASTPAIEIQDPDFYYGDFQTVKNVDIAFHKHEVTALIVPSGCGKSTVLRTMNRMNDLIPGTRADGKVLFHGKNIYDDGVDPV